MNEEKSSPASEAETDKEKPFISGPAFLQIAQHEYETELSRVQVLDTKAGIITTFTTAYMALLVDKFDLKPLFDAFSLYSMLHMLVQEFISFRILCSVPCFRGLCAD
jgi:hypothetical protein